MKKARPTKAGTFRISHTSFSHSLIGKKANKRRRVARKRTAPPGASNTNLREVEYKGKVQVAVQFYGSPV